MLDDASVSENTLCLGPRRKAAKSANGVDTPASIENQADAGCGTLQRDFAMSALAGTQSTRLINAACKAFFVRRGLEPEVDWAAAVSVTSRQGVHRRMNPSRRSTHRKPGRKQCVKAISRKRQQTAEAAQST